MQTLKTSAEATVSERSQWQKTENKVIDKKLPCHPKRHRFRALDLVFVPTTVVVFQLQEIESPPPPAPECSLSLFVPEQSADWLIIDINHPTTRKDHILERTQSIKSQLSKTVRVTCHFMLEKMFDLVF